MYRDQGFHSMWVLAVSPSVDLIHMLEAGLVMAFYKHVGCRNQKGTGGEGALNKKNRAPPPYFLYVTGGRADQARRVGWDYTNSEGWKIELELPASCKSSHPMMFSWTVSRKQTIKINQDSPKSK